MKLECDPYSENNIKTFKNPNSKVVLMFNGKVDLLWWITATPFNTQNLHGFHWNVEYLTPASLWIKSLYFYLPTIFIKRSNIHKKGKISSLCSYENTNAFQDWCNDRGKALHCKSIILFIQVYKNQNDCKGSWM